MRAEYPGLDLEEAFDGVVGEDDDKNVDGNLEDDDDPNRVRKKVTRRGIALLKRRIRYACLVQGCPQIPHNARQYELHLNEHVDNISEPQVTVATTGYRCYMQVNSSTDSLLSYRLHRDANNQWLLWIIVCCGLQDKAIPLLETSLIPLRTLLTPVGRVQQDALHKIWTDWITRCDCIRVVDEHTLRFGSGATKQTTHISYKRMHDLIHQTRGNILPALEHYWNVRAHMETDWSETSSTVCLAYLVHQTPPRGVIGPSHVLQCVVGQMTKAAPSRVQFSNGVLLQCDDVDTLFVRFLAKYGKQKAHGGHRLYTTKCLQVHFF